MYDWLQAQHDHKGHCQGKVCCVLPLFQIARDCDEANLDSVFLPVRANCVSDVTPQQLRHGQNVDESPATKDKTPFNHIIVVIMEMLQDGLTGDENQQSEEEP
jgi:hypothetical protein